VVDGLNCIVVSTITEDHFHDITMPLMEQLPNTPDVHSPALPKPTCQTAQVQKDKKT